MVEKMEKGEETIFFSRVGLGRKKKAERKEEERKRWKRDGKCEERERGRRERNNYLLLKSGSWEEKVVVDCRYKAILTGEEREASETGGGGRAEAAVDTFPCNLKLEAWHCIFAHYLI